MICRAMRISLAWCGFLLWQFFQADTSADKLADGQWSLADHTDPATLVALLKVVNPRLLQEVNPTNPEDLARTYFGTYRVGTGERFAYPIPPRIIDNHQPSSDPAIPPYGVAFVFFTACAGHIGVAPDWKNVTFDASLNLSSKLTNATLGFPFVCLDDAGNALGPDDYVAGYTQEFVYGNGSVNKNPVIDGINTDMPHDHVPQNKDMLESSDALRIDGACVPEPIASATNGCLNDALPVDPCKDHCPEYVFQPVLNKDLTQEQDTFATRPDQPVWEQVWVDYYADGGKLKNTARSVQDSTLGWFNDYGTKWTPPSDSGPVNIWAVVHDNRGGVAWTRLQICVGSQSAIDAG